MSIFLKKLWTIKIKLSSGIYACSPSERRITCLGRRSNPFPLFLRFIENVFFVWNSFCIIVCGRAEKYGPNSCLHDGQGWRSGEHFRGAVDVQVPIWRDVHSLRPWRPYRLRTSHPRHLLPGRGKQNKINSSPKKYTFFPGFLGNEHSLMHAMCVSTYTKKVRKEQIVPLRTSIGKIWCYSEQNVSMAKLQEEKQ